MPKIKFTIRDKYCVFDEVRLTSKQKLFEKIKILLNQLGFKNSYRVSNPFLTNYKEMRFSDLASIAFILVACFNAGVGPLGECEVLSSGIWKNGKFLIITEWIDGITSHRALIDIDEVKEIVHESNVLLRPYSDFVHLYV